MLVGVSCPNRNLPFQAERRRTPTSPAELASAFGYRTVKDALAIEESTSRHISVSVFSADSPLWPFTSFLPTLACSCSTLF